MPTACANVPNENSAVAITAAQGGFVSIVIPMRNEERFIGQCLDSILASDFPSRAYEILVVDGCSTDSSRAIVEQKASASSAIRLLQNVKGTTPNGLNVGIRHARGDYVIRMDAHAEYPPDYIRNCVSELERTGAANVGGTLITKPGASTLIAEGIAAMTQTKTGVGNSAYRTGDADRYVDTVPFGTFRRSLFKEIGLFRDDLDRSQDFEFNARIRKAGGRVYLSPIIHSTYYNAPTFKKFIRQGWRNGLWVGRTWLRYPGTFCCRHAAPLAMVLATALPLLLSFAYGPCVWIPIFSLAMYLLVIAAAALRIAWKGPPRMLAVVPLLMVSYHFVYGVATFAGLLSSERSTYVRRPPSTLQQNDPDFGAAA